MNNQNDKLEKGLKQLLLALDMTGMDTKQRAYVLDALVQLHKAEKDEEYFKVLQAETSRLADEMLSGNSELKAGELANLKLANAFYYVAEVTGEERYIDAAKKAARQLAVQPRNEAGIFVDADGSVSLGAAYLSQVFYMKYETANGGKERYNDIIAQYNAMRSSIYDSVAAAMTSNADDEVASGAQAAASVNVDMPVGTKANAAAAQMAEYCAALIDTMEVVDQPLYEIFRRMQDLYKEAVRALIEAGVFAASDATALRASYAVLKGCRMKALHTEKYEKIALKVLEAAESSVEAEEHKGDVCYITALAICYSESLKNRQYQDYGRGKGGALWS